MIDGGSFGGAGKVTIKDLTITQGLATEDATFPASGGGILDLEADLTLKDDVLTANQAPLGGAGAMIYRGSLTASGSTWSNNLIIGGVSSGTVGSDTLFNEGSGVDLFVSGGQVFLAARSPSTQRRGSVHGRRRHLSGGGSQPHRLGQHVQRQPGNFWAGNRLLGVNTTVDDLHLSTEIRQASAVVRS